MYWYYLTIKILLWAVLQVKRRRIRVHILVLADTEGREGSIVVISTGKEEEDHLLVLANTQDSTVGISTGCFDCFASITKQRVSMFPLNRNKQKTKRNSLMGSIFWHFFQKI
jgi:hypothetical protein